MEEEFQLPSLEMQMLQTENAVSLFSRLTRRFPHPRLTCFLPLLESMQKLTQDFLKVRSVSISFCSALTDSSHLVPTRRKQARTTVPHHPHSFVPHSGGAVEKVALATAKAEDAIADAINRKREFVVLAQEHATFH